MANHFTIQTTISDLVQISPEDAEKPSGESIEDNINAKYANKVWNLHKRRDLLTQLLLGRPEDRPMHMRVRYPQSLRWGDRSRHWHR